jgi:hypothetical protein
LLLNGSDTVGEFRLASPTSLVTLKEDGAVVTVVDAS